MPQGMPLSGYEVGGSLTNIEVEIRVSFLAQSKKETGAWICAMPRGLTSMANQTFISLVLLSAKSELGTNSASHVSTGTDKLKNTWLMPRKRPQSNVAVDA
jgi:hypothetical protein